MGCLAGYQRGHQGHSDVSKCGAKSKQGQHLLQHSRWDSARQRRGKSLVAREGQFQGCIHWWPRHRLTWALLLGKVTALCITFLISNCTPKAHFYPIFHAVSYLNQHVQSVSIPYSLDSLTERTVRPGVKSPPYPIAKKNGSWDVNPKMHICHPDHLVCVENYLARLKITTFTQNVSPKFIFLKKTVFHNIKINANATHNTSYSSFLPFQLLSEI